MAISLTFYLIIALTAREGLGAADIRLAGLLGLALAWHSWTVFLTGTILGLLYGGLTGTTMITVSEILTAEPVIPHQSPWERARKGHETRSS